MSRQKMHTTVYLRPDQALALERFSKASGISQALLIRAGIDWVLGIKATQEIKQTRLVKKAVQS